MAKTDSGNGRRIRNVVGQRWQRRVTHRQLQAEILERRELLAADLKLSSIPREPEELLKADREFYAGFSNGGSGIEGRSQITLADTFRLHSRPLATKTIFLDFDGFTTTGTAWNSLRNRDPIVSPAWDADRDGPAFSDNELRRIQGIWQRVAADFTAFDVNVTTQDPGQADLVNSGGSDTRWGIRVVFTPDDFPGPGSGGVAYVNSFNWGANPGASDTPAYVFNMSEVAAAGAASHEVGHTLGLDHDGTTSQHPTEPNQAYYTGHGSGETSWGPIMGVGGYYRNVTTWDNGSYFAANNGATNANFGAGPDDLQIITTKNGFGYVPDPEANVIAGAQPLSSIVDYSTSLANLSQFGVISGANDVDVFSFQTGSGLVNLTFDPYVIQTWVKAPDGSLTSSIEDVFFNSNQWSQNQGTNLDLSATLYDATGAVVATSNPNGLRASFSNLLLSAGTYYVAVDGVGFGSPTANPPTGYSDYSSIGQYLISGTVPVALGLILPTGPVVYVEDQPPVQVADSVSVFDGIAGGYANAQLSATMAPISGLTDRLGFSFAATGLAFNDGAVEDGGQTVAVLSHSSPTRLTWSLTGDTTVNSIEKLVRSITFEAQGNAPDTRARSVRFQLSKGTLTTNDEIPVTVIATNDAPSLLNTSLMPVEEDSLFSIGQSVSEIFTGTFRDPDPGDRLRGVAIVGDTTPAEQGSWQVVVGSGAFWQNLPAVSEVNRLALDLNARLRFIPAPDFFGTTAPLLVQAIDNTYTGLFSRASNLVYLPPALVGPQSPVSQAASPVSILVTPINDAPRATVSELRFTVTQDQSLDGRIPSEAIIDIDDSVLSYTAVQASGSQLPGWLKIDPVSGTFSGTPGKLDVGNLQILLTATDSGRLKITLPVLIEILNVNDPPTELRIVGTSVNENALGARVGRLFSFDVDGDQVDWTSSDPRFVIRDRELFLNGPLDFEIPEDRRIQLTLKATDTGSPQMFETLDVVINTLDMNEFFPNLQSERFEVLDGTEAGTLVKRVEAVDGDTAQSITYRLVGGDISHFSLNQITGDLRLATRVSLSKKAEYKIFVEATDNGSPSFSSTAQLIVNVQPRNDYAPEFRADGIFIFPENSAAGMSIGQVPVVDQDGNPLRFELLGVIGGASDWVEVEPLTGRVTLTAAHQFDFESSINYALQVRVQETIPGGQTITGMVPIQLVNANDRPTGVTGLNIYPSRQGVQVTSGFVVQDQDLSPTGYTISTTDSRFEVRNGRLALRPTEFINVNQVGQTLLVQIRINDNSDATSFNNVMASVQVVAAGTWQNPGNSLDVNRDGKVTASDALAIIARLNDSGFQRSLPLVRSFEALVEDDIDASGDNFLSAADALLVINELNRAPRTGREGESPLLPAESSEVVRPKDELWFSAFSQLEEERESSRRRLKA